MRRRVVGLVAGSLLVAGCSSTTGGAVVPAGSVGAVPSTSAAAGAGTGLDATEAEPTADELCALLTPDELGASGPGEPSSPGKYSQPVCRWQFDGGDVFLVELTSYPEGRPRTGISAAFDPDRGPVSTVQVQGRDVEIGPTSGGECGAAVGRTVGEIWLEVSAPYGDTDAAIPAMCTRAEELAGVLVPRLPLT